ncbi:ribonuclease H-like domain-containing protein [Tanacetum coccineum]
MAIGDTFGSVELINNLDVGNPLYLQTNDNTGLAIINVKLVGAENYKMWATAMKIALKGKNKIGFIDGTCVKQESSDVLSQQWERCNAIVLGWILGSLSQDLYVGQVYFEIDSEVWAELKETFDKTGWLNSLWREFDIFVCEGTTACTCDAKSGSVKHTQLIRLMQFLMGLNDVYQLIRSTILTKHPLPNVKDALYVVSREESYKGLHPGGSGTNKSQPSAFVVKTNNNTNNFNRKMMKHLSLINENPSPAANMSGIKSKFSNNNISFKLPSFYNNNVFFNLNFEKFFCAKSKSEMFNVTLGWIIDSGANQHMTDSTKDMFNVVDISSLMLTVGHCDNRKFS